tara:strand:+ start:758 stop:1216 length:459 start_codon:yes stop_codon:yes gene_type:complete
MKKLLIIIFLLTLSCSNNKVVKNHGITGLELKTNKIEVLKSNKNDVLKIIGKPSTVSLFDENSWLYIQRETINQSVLKLGKSKIQKNNVLEVVFNKYGLVESKKLYNLDDMNDIKIVKNTTKKKYDDSSTITKLIKSLEQKVNSPKNSNNKK